MEISFAFFADSAVALPDGKVYVLGGGFNVLAFPELPAAASFAVVAGFRFGGPDAGQSYEIELRLVDADGGLVVAPVSMQFQSAGPAPEPGRDVAIQTVTPLTPMFGRPGNYRVEFWSGQTLLTGIAFAVDERPAAVTPALPAN